jgi:hypothetical protein
VWLTPTEEKAPMLSRLPCFLTPKHDGHERVSFCLTRMQTQRGN